MNVILKIYMLGGVKVYVDDRDITHEFPLKSLALLCYLAYNKKTAIKRSKLVYMFWNGSTDEASKYNLRYNLWCIRKILRKYLCNEECIVSPAQSTCQFNCSVEHYIDAFEFMKFCKDGERDVYHFENAVEIYRGDFFEDYCIKESPEFDNWVFFERERLQKMLLLGLNRLSECYILRNNTVKSIQCLEKMLSLNELQEEIYIKLMKLHMASDDISSAVGIYKRYSKVMREELKLPPNAEAQKMFLIMNARDISGKTVIDCNYDKYKSQESVMLNNYVRSRGNKLFISSEDYLEVCGKLKEMNYIYYTFYKDSSVINENIFEFIAYIIKNNLSYIQKNVSKEYLDNIYNVIPGIGHNEQIWIDRFGEEYRFYYSSFKILEALTQQFELLLFTDINVKENELNSFITFMEQRLSGKIKRIYYGEMK